MNKSLILVVLVAAVAMAFCHDRNSTTTVTEVVPTTPASAPASPKTYEQMKAEAAEKILAKKAEAKSNGKETVDLTSLAGRKLNSLYSMYLGLKPGAMVPRSVQVSFDERMATMYHQKVEWKKCKKSKTPGDEPVCQVASDTVLSHAPMLLDRFISGDKMKMSLGEFIASAEKEAEVAKGSIDWKALCARRIYKLSAKKCILLREVVGNLRGRDLVAYGMTELLPSDDGTLNVAFMEVLLHNAGAQFLYHIPALGDRYASLSFYQFTFFALRDDEEKTEGASIVSASLRPGGKSIPGSVVDLVGHDNHVAAMYFAVHNLALLVSSMNDVQATTLAKIHSVHQDEVVVFIATAHHKPAKARPTFVKWVDAKGKELASPKGKKKLVTPPLEKFFHGSLLGYAVKTNNNLHALYKLHPPNS